MTHVEHMTEVIKLNLKLFKSDCSDACILVSGAKKIPNTGAAAAPYNRKNIIIKM